MMVLPHYLHFNRTPHRHTDMTILPLLHATRESSERAQAAAALGRLAAGETMVYNKITALVQDVERYVLDASSDAAPACEWINRAMKPPQRYCTNVDGDKMLMASAMARLLVPVAREQLYTREQPNQAYALAKRAQALAEAAQAALCSHVFVRGALPPVIGQRAAVTATALSAAALADLAVVTKHGDSIFNTQDAPPAPGTRLHALLKLATSSAVRSLAAARLAHVDDAAQQHGTTCGTAMAYRYAVVAAMERALDNDGSVGRQVHALKQASALANFLLAKDRPSCQNAMDAAWMRNGLRLEPELASTVLSTMTPSTYLGMCRNKEGDAPVWAGAR